MTRIKGLNLSTCYKEAEKPHIFFAVSTAFASTKNSPNKNRGGFLRQGVTVLSFGRSVMFDIKIDGWKMS